MFGLSLIEVIYWASTIIGGTLFILRLGIMLIGGGDFGNDGIDADVDTGTFDASGDHADADISFKLLSVQGLTSFFMMFGLVGLALLRANLHELITIAGGTLAGLAMVAITGVVFTQMKRLQTEGTIKIENTIGSDGTVYLTIPKNGTGQVQVIAQGSLKIFDAVSANKNHIATGEKVHVTGVASGNTLIVEKL
jgi:hypothetical protein